MKGQKVGGLKTMEILKAGEYKCLQIEGPVAACPLVARDGLSRCTHREERVSKLPRASFIRTWIPSEWGLS